MYSMCTVRVYTEISLVKETEKIPNWKAKDCTYSNRKGQTKSLSKVILDSTYIQSSDTAYNNFYY